MVGVGEMEVGGVDGGIWTRNRWREVDGGIWGKGKKLNLFLE